MFGCICPGRGTQFALGYIFPGLNGRCASAVRIAGGTLPLPILWNLGSGAYFSGVGPPPNGHSLVQLVLHVLVRHEPRSPKGNGAGPEGGELVPCAVVVVAFLSLSLYDIFSLLRERYLLADGLKRLLTYTL